MIKNISIATLLLLSSLSADFTRDDNLDVVNDSETCLMWQDDLETKSSTNEKNWEDAIDYCGSLELAGHSDWKLPNFNELYSVVDTNKSAPTIKEAFQNTASQFSSGRNYWTSTSYSPEVNAKAWIIKFEDANDAGRSKDDTNYIRCVRDNH